VKGSILLNHHLGGFDDSGDGVPFLELEFVSATACDDALNQIVPDPNDNMSHYVAELNFFNFSAQFVSS
jgi:hypothetical protein